MHRINQIWLTLIIKKYNFFAQFLQTLHIVTFSYFLLLEGSKKKQQKLTYHIALSPFLHTIAKNTKHTHSNKHAVQYVKYVQVLSFLCEHQF